jgi:hypothetical protein
MCFLNEMYTTGGNEKTADLVDKYALPVPTLVSSYAILKSLTSILMHA